jgi:hypothetical protein
VRNLLGMAALTAIRRRSPFRAFYDRLTSRGRPRKVALVAVMGTLLTTSTRSSGTERMAASKRLTPNTAAPSSRCCRRELGA